MNIDMSTKNKDTTETTIGYESVLSAFKNGRLKEWFYYFQNGHPFLLAEEVDIIIDTRLNDKTSMWMNDTQIQKLVQLRTNSMYKKKYPNAKRWSLTHF
jgi:hypothetical protein